VGKVKEGFSPEPAIVNAQERINPDSELYWRPIESAPQDRPIVGWCVDECSDPDCDYSGGNKGRLCVFHAHAEGLSRCGLGPQVLEWGGAFDDSSWEYPNQAHLPDWWFRKGSEFEVVANPTHWMPLPEPPK